MSFFIQRCREDGTLMQEADIWRVCEAISKGLSVLHEKNIIHRDIKPQNVLVMADLTFKVSTVHLNCLDCRYGHLKISSEQLKPFLVVFKSGHTPLCNSRTDKVAAIQLQSRYLGPRMFTPLLSLPLAAIQDLRCRLGRQPAV
jgi:serine/threonine protein kinase